MNTGSKVAIGVGAAALIGIAAYYVISKSKIGKYLLQTTAGPGGTINPNSASGIYEPAGSVVPITITAANGYTIGQVLEDGSPINTSTTDTTETYQITMNQNHEIDVTFYQGGQPPVGAPYQIQALNAQTIIWGYYGAKVTINALASPSTCDVATCDSNWTYGNVAQTQIQFKVIDSNGNGVPAVKVQVYPSLFPDASQFQGYLIVNSQMANQSNPAIIYSDSSGIVTANLSYYYGLNDNLLSICQAAQLYLWVGLCPFAAPLGITVENDVSIPNACIVLSKGGHGITGQSPAAMGPMQPNTIIAQIPNTSIPQATCLCTCGFNVKML